MLFKSGPEAGTKIIIYSAIAGGSYSTENAQTWGINILCTTPFTLYVIGRKYYIIIYIRCQYTLQSGCYSVFRQCIT